ncbi:hypothetical protein D3C73_1551300 [compost metagenome]
MRDQHVAVRGGTQAARMPFKQRQPDIVFQVFQPLRQAGLRGVQHCRRMADVAGLRQAQQHLQIAQPQAVGPVHAGPHPWGVVSYVYVYWYG